MLRRLALCRVFLAFVAQRGDVWVAVERVVVEIHLGVERQQIAVNRHHQRIDLEHRRIAPQHGVVERREQLERGFHRLAFEPEAERQFARMKCLAAACRIDGDGDDLLRRFRRHGFDLHPALG